MCVQYSTSRLIDEPEGRKRGERSAHDEQPVARVDDLEPTHFIADQPLGQPGRQNLLATVLTIYSSQSQE